MFASMHPISQTVIRYVYVAISFPSPHVRLASFDSGALCYHRYERGISFRIALHGISTILEFEGSEAHLHPNLQTRMQLG